MEQLVFRHGHRFNPCNPRRQNPTRCPALPPNTAPIFVVLSHPTQGSTWSADTPIPVEVRVTSRGHPSKDVEFWTDGTPFRYPRSAPNRLSLYKVWSWMPLTRGGRAVFVRATDVNGRTADSNAVHVVASAAAGVLTVQTEKGGDTIQSLARLNGVDSRTDSRQKIRPSTRPGQFLRERRLLSPPALSPCRSPANPPPRLSPAHRLCRQKKVSQAVYLYILNGH